MGIISQTIKVKVGSRNFKHYKELGYNFEHRGDEIEVKIEHLPMHTKERVLVRCDMCDKNEMWVAYNNYNSVVNRSGSYVCQNCSTIKQNRTVKQKYNVFNISQIESVKEKKKETCLKHFNVENPMQSNDIKENYKNIIYNKYGVDNISQCVDIKNKKEETFLRHFGVDNPMKNYDIKERAKSSYIEKYGVSNPMQNNMVKNNFKQSFLNKYGVEYPLQILEAKEKMVNSFLRKYGVSNPMQSPEIRAKANETLCKNGTQKTSKQQIYLHSIYGGELNYAISYYAVDICFPEEKLVIEYDGGGHDLRVTLGRLTQEEFNQKEIIRNNIIKREGYKQMRIISTKDLLPSDTILLQMLSQAKEYFSDYPEHSWIEFNIDTSTVRNAEQKDGVFFDYGELRKIKEVA